MVSKYSPPLPASRPDRVLPSLYWCLVLRFSVALCRYNQTQIHIVSPPFFFLSQRRESVEYILFCTWLFHFYIFEIFPLLHRESFLILSPLCWVPWMGHSLFNPSPLRDVWVVAKLLPLQTAYSGWLRPGLVLHCEGVVWGCCVDSAKWKLEGARWPCSWAFPVHTGTARKECPLPTALPTDSVCQLRWKWSYRSILTCISRPRRWGIFSCE